MVAVDLNGSRVCFLLLFVIVDLLVRHRRHHGGGHDQGMGACGDVAVGGSCG